MGVVPGSWNDVNDVITGNRESHMGVVPGSWNYRKLMLTL